MTIFERLLSRPVYFAILVALVAFVIYLQTLAPSVDWIDAGELATVCTTLGIAHPTGYPLFTLIGWIFAHLPIAGSAILHLNIMAAFFTALGAGGIVFLATELFQYWMPERIGIKEKRVESKGASTKNKSRRLMENTNKGSLNKATSFTLRPLPLAILAASASGVAAAFSATWWDQSTSIEVYPVHLCMVPIVLTFFLRMLRQEEDENVARDGKLFALTLGLSFANHMTTILIAPATLYMFFARYGFAGSAWRRIIKLAPFFIIGLAVYIYLPIRSAMYPIMDWGHPTTWGAFLRHVTGGQYKIWMFSGSGAAAKQWAYFWSRVPKEFTILGAIIALAGVWQMFMSASVRRTHILAFTLLLFFGCLLYSINYDIHDIDSYFLLAYLAISLWIGAGAIAIARYASTIKKEYVLAAIVILLGTIEIAGNYKDVDESGNYMVEDYTKNVLTNLPPNAIIFSTQWDFWVSGAFYFQLVEHLRPDVLVIDKAMLRDRPWYYAELIKRAPTVFGKVKPEMDNFLHYLWAFDRGEPFNEGAIAPAYEQFTSALVERNLDRPIFITQEMVDERDDLFAPHMKVVPGGIAYRLVPRDTTFDILAPKIRWRDKSYRKRDYYTDDSRLLQAIPMVSYAQTRLQHGDKESAKQFLDAALRLTPDLDANIEELSDRDKSIAIAANEKFTQIQALRKQLGQ